MEGDGGDEARARAVLQQEVQQLLELEGQLNAQFQAHMSQLQQQQREYQRVEEEEGQQGVEGERDTHCGGGNEDDVEEGRERAAAGRGGASEVQ